jgi:cell volume regulation protein A
MPVWARTRPNTPLARAAEIFRELRHSASYMSIWHGDGVTEDAVLILVAGALLAAGVLASLVAARVRLPALVLFLGLGMLVGTDGLGWIDFENYELTRFIGSTALLLILFEGGLAAGFDEIRPALRPAISLAIVATVGTAVIVALAATLLFDLPPLEAFLLGAVLSGTDGAAVFALLRGSRLRTDLARTLEGEAGFNDPIAVLLVLACIELLTQPAYGALDVLVFFIRELGIGTLVGIAMGALGVVCLRALRFAPPSLTLLTSFATAAIAYGAAGALHGSGFLAVYLAGLAVGSVDLPAKRSVDAFHEGLAAVAEVGMFFTLGLLVFPSQLGRNLIESTLLALIVAFIARPVAAAAATVFEPLSWRDRVLLGWTGLRGAVPVILATFPVIEDIPRSREFFNVVFFAVLVSTVIQGSTVEALANRLGSTEQPRLRNDVPDRQQR